MREIEIKFKVNNSRIFKKKLKTLKAKFLGKAFEGTVRFDTQAGDLEKAGKFLRLCSGFKNTITFDIYRRKFMLDIVL
ncbi:MAG: hypothetical protein AAB653_01955 [Patescibacteria group bacterium]